MLEPRTPARSFPAYLAERRVRLDERLANRSTPTEAMHAVRELLDELLTIELSERSTRERQIGERALRIVRDALGLLQVVHATTHWSRPVGSTPRRPGRPWRVLGLIGVQVLLGLGLAWLLAGVLQRGAVSGDGSLAFALLLVAGTWRCSRRSRATSCSLGVASARRSVDDRPEIGLSVDGDGLMSTLSQALLAVDQLEQVAAPPEPAVRNRAGLADYSELLRAIQHVYAARLSDGPRRAAAGRRAPREPGTVRRRAPRRVDGERAAATGRSTTQRSLDPSSTEYRVILPVCDRRPRGDRARPHRGAGRRGRTTRGAAEAGR